jgi:SAM-dependent methyltransferase
MTSSNPKAQAWDAIGLDYYFLGRRSGKPTRASIAWFVRGLDRNSRCLIVGGTSVGVVRAALRSGCYLKVVDFSGRVCADLRRQVPEGVHIVRRDVLAPAPAEEGSFSHLLCDALINRFDAGEARRFERQGARLLRPGGVLRATVKLGNYPMDLRLLEMAGDSSRPTFWDEATQTIDYGRLGCLLERGFVRHGGIRRQDLLSWYRHRGREKRYQAADLRQLFGSGRWVELAIQPEAPGSDRVRLEARRALR